MSAAPGVRCPLLCDPLPGSSAASQVQALQVTHDSTKQQQQEQQQCGHVSAVRSQACTDRQARPAGALSPHAPPT